MNNKIDPYFSGNKLYGDDFSKAEIEEWFRDESEGYANLGAKIKKQYFYSYHALNVFHAYRFLRNRTFNRALGIGSAYGDEFLPLAKNIQEIFVLDPSDAFSDIETIGGVPCAYKKPNSSGDIPFDNNFFDLITSLGVMHHIPNVSYVMGECFRCLNSSGIMLLREPITSMGDWRKARTGLTKAGEGNSD